MSQKMVGRTGWSVTDLIGTADFLGVTPDALMDDSVLIRAEAGYKKTPVEARALEAPATGLEPVTVRYTVLARSRRAFCNRSRQYTSLAVPSNRRVIAHVRLAAGFPKSIGQKRAIVFLGK